MKKANSLTPISSNLVISTSTPPCVRSTSVLGAVSDSGEARLLLGEHTCVSTRVREGRMRMQGDLGVKGQTGF
jgi:hypothetical protein